MDLQPGDMMPGVHWPYCIDRSCPGCMPVVPVIVKDEPPELDLSIFRNEAMEP
jgi:hypothetical protein